MRRDVRRRNKRAEAILAVKLALILVVFVIVKGLDWVAGEEGGFGVFSGLFVFRLSLAFAVVVYFVSTQRIRLSRRFVELCLLSFRPLSFCLSCR